MGEGRPAEAPPPPRPSPIIADDSGRSSASNPLAANFSGWDQKFLAGQLLPPFISFPVGSEEAISRHFHPSRATSPPPLIHKGARRRLPGHVGGAHRSRAGRSQLATPRLEARHPATQHPATRHPATRHPGGRPSGPTPTQHERCHALTHGADGVRQWSRRPRPPAPRLGNQDRPADRLALLRGPQQPHHDVERPARAGRGSQGESARSAPRRRPPSTASGGDGRTRPGCGGPRAHLRAEARAGSRPAVPRRPPAPTRPRPASGREGGPGGEEMPPSCPPPGCVWCPGSATRVVAPGAVHRPDPRGRGPGGWRGPGLWRGGRPGHLRRPGPGPAARPPPLPGGGPGFPAVRAPASGEGAHSQAWGWSRRYFAPISSKLGRGGIFTGSATE